MCECFSTRLHQLRTKKKVSASVASELCGFHHDAMRRYENGLSEPRVTELLAISDYYGCSINWLCGKE